MKAKLLYIVGGLVIIGLFAFAMNTNSGEGFLGGVSNMDSLTLSDDLVVGGVSTFTGANTFANDVILTQSAFCIDFYATSTETQLNMTASSTATIEGVDGVMMFEYGSCQ